MSLPEPVEEIPLDPTPDNGVSYRYRVLRCRDGRRRRRTIRQGTSVLLHEDLMRNLTLNLDLYGRRHSAGTHLYLEVKPPRHWRKPRCLRTPWQRVNELLYPIITVNT